jgi:phage gpG-like protein
MNFDMQVTGMAELRQRIEAMKARAADLKPGLTRAAMVVLRASKDAIKSGGGSRGQWAPNQTGTPLLFKSGRLINSLSIGASGNILALDASSVEVGTNVFYARYMQQGTGVFGPSGKRIFPTHAKALAWPGHVVRSIAGSKPRPFLYIDDAQAAKIRDVFSHYILQGLPATNNDS